MHDDVWLGPGSTLLGRYTLERRLGVGGFAAVWSARDSACRDERVALKILHPRHRKSLTTMARFEREARILAALDHPHIAAARGYHVDPSCALIVMEYVHGRSLRAQLDARALRQAPLTPAEVRALLTPIAQALAHAHEAGIVHRDVKPANVIVPESTPDLPKLVDFGIAKDLGCEPPDATTRGQWVGSMVYLTPEQIRSEPVDVRTDVFALGCVLFELATLRRAWVVGDDARPLYAHGGPLVLEGLNDPGSVLRRILTGPRPQVTPFRPELPVALDEVLATACAVSPEQRYPTVLALLEATQAALGAARRRRTWTMVAAPMVTVAERAPAAGGVAPSHGVLEAGGTAEVDGAGAPPARDEVSRDTPRSRRATPTTLPWVHVVAPSEDTSVPRPQPEDEGRATVVVVDVEPPRGGAELERDAPEVLYPARPRAPTPTLAARPSATALRRRRLSLRVLLGSGPAPAWAGAADGPARADPALAALAARAVREPSPALWHARTPRDAGPSARAAVEGAGRHKSPERDVLARHLAITPLLGAPEALPLPRRVPTSAWGALLAGLGALGAGSWLLSVPSLSGLAPLLALLAVALVAGAAHEVRAATRLRDVVLEVLREPSPGLRWRRVRAHARGYVLEGALDTAEQPALSLTLVERAYRGARGVRVRLSWTLPPRSELRRLAPATLVVADLVSRRAPQLPPAAAGRMCAAERTLAQHGVRSAALGPARLSLSFDWLDGDAQTLRSVAQAAVRIFRAA